MSFMNVVFIFGIPHENKLLRYSTTSAALTRVRIVAAAV